MLKDAWLGNGDMVAWVSCLRPESSTHDGSTHDGSAQWVCGHRITMQEDHHSSLMGYTLVLGLRVVFALLQ